MPPWFGSSRGRSGVAGAAITPSPVSSIATAPPRPVRGVQRVIATVTRGDGADADSVSTTNGAGGSPACVLARPSAIAGH